METGRNYQASKAYQPPSSFPFKAAICAVFALLVVGAAGINYFAKLERDQALSAERRRMERLLDGRTKAIEDWLKEQKEVLASVAINPSVRVYLQGYNAGDGADLDLVVEGGYVRSFLAAKARATGFHVEAGNGAGLAIADTTGRLLLGTSAIPAFDKSLSHFAAGVAEGKLSLKLLSEGLSALAFGIPVPGPEGDIAGVAIGIKNAGAELVSLLKLQAETLGDATFTLVRNGDNGMEILAATHSDIGIVRDIARNYRAQADRHEKSGNFVIQKGTAVSDVLIAERAIPGTDWILLHVVNTREALKDINRYLMSVVISGVLFAIVAGTVLFAALQRKQLKQLLSEAQLVQQQIEGLSVQKDLLRLITDSQTKSIFVTDERGIVLFANQGMAMRTGTGMDDLIGKPLAQVVGTDAANLYMQRTYEALQANAPVIETDRKGTSGAPIITQVQHIPLPPQTMLGASVLVVEDDMTSHIVERERRERTLRQVVKVMVAMADRRDPNAANHSTRVGKLARAVALEMKLEPVLIETAETAGELMNLGKILVPTELLTRPGPLTPEELRLVRNSLRTSAEFLSSIEFDGPVAQTLLQSQERYDGSGWPDGWQGEDILITSRILAVANAFVALISPRAHRPGMTMDLALKVLMDESGAAFDRRVVAALLNYMDNEGGRVEWEPKGASVPADA